MVILPWLFFHCLGSVECHFKIYAPLTNDFLKPLPFLVLFDLALVSFPSVFYVCQEDTSVFIPKIFLVRAEKLSCHTVYNRGTQ